MENMTAESHKTTVVISQCQIFDLVFTTTCLSRPIVHTQTCFCHIEGHCIKYHYFQKDKFLFIISSFLKFTEGITHFKIIVTIGSFSMYILVKNIQYGYKVLSVAQYEAAEKDQTRV